MRVGVKINGLDKVLDKLDGIDKMHRDKALKDGLADGGLVAIQEAKRLVPVDTGDLQDSLHVGGYTKLTPEYRKIGAYGALKGPIGSGKSVGVIIGSTLPYSHLVENGTRKMKAQPFLRPAIDGKQREILDAVDNKVQEIIDEA